MRRLLFAALFVFLVGCVQIPEEPVKEVTPTTPTVTLPAPAPKQEPLKQESPLAPLPEEKKANTSTQSPAPQQKTVQSGWTTDSLSIAEGETKYVYIK